MTLYFDTSALIKLLIDEEDAEIAVGLWNSRHAVAVGVLAYPEARAALAAARRASRLTEHGYRTSLTDLEALHGATLVVGIDDSLARHAGDLAAEHHLRGYDAVHLASALRLGDRTTLITWDQRLQHAAVTAGLAVAPAP
ncbi:MAG TPA: type II toxin-antitoxin system VapC family toxin [Solirubrobacteraceae bacterium]